MTAPLAAPTTVVFIHIPKTAGTTLRQIIARHYPPDAIYTFGAPFGQTVDEFMALPDAQKRRLKFIQGHIGYGIQEHLPQPTSCFTLLREPTARAISYYHYLKRHPELTHGKTIRERQLTLHEYIAQKISASGSDNGQTRFLGAGQAAGNDLAFGSVTREMLERAKENLRDHFALVGLVEAFDETLLMLGEIYGWTRLWYIPENVNPQQTLPTNVSAETRALIRAYNAYDLELYDYARMLYRARLRAQPPPFRARLVWFQTLNRHPQLRHALARLRQPLRALTRRG